MLLSPPKGTITDGFLKIGYEEKAEAEEALSVTISSDEALWESNEFSKYEGVWTQSSVDKVVLLFTYLALNSIAKLRVRLDAYTMDESVDLPWGTQDQNKWVIYGYVNERQRVVRSRDGASLGQWFLQTLEPDATANVLKYQMLCAPSVAGTRARYLH